MQIVATQIRPGMVLLIEEELYRVTWTMHRTPGKGNACMQTKLKNIINGRNLEKRFLSADRVEKAELQTKTMQFLYKDSEGFNFMDHENYEQMQLPNDLIGESERFLSEGTLYVVTFYEENPVGLELPKTIDLKVTYAPPEVKKATATATMRPVELENGMTIQAPGFIKEGDFIKVNTETGEYLERVNP
jgi:elongation factor P